MQRTDNKQTDFVGVAADMGYKDASIAKTRWSQIKKKKITGSAPAGGVDKTPPNKKTPAKAKKATVAGEGVEGDTPKTPAKRGRKPKSAPKIKAEESGEAEVGDAGSDADVAGDGAETAGEEVKAGA